MKSEEVKYVYQDGGNLLVPEKNTSGVYQETTVRPLNTGSKGNKEGNNRKCWFSKVQIILPIVALVLCVIVIIVLLATGTSSGRESAQDAEIASLKEVVENQQVRLHRMQKELQFLISRQQANEAREASMRRSQSAIIPPSNIGTGTGTNSWPVPLEPKTSLEEELAAPVVPDPDLPILPIRDLPAPEEEAVDVDKLPRATANKKRKGGKLDQI